jgi:diguanylate cyclase (GGDEF)-like protein
MPRILIIDDNTSETEKLRAELKHLNYETACTATGADGIVTAQKFSPEIILLNPILPDMNGYDVCRKLREKKETSHIPILLVVAPSKPMDKQANLSLENADYIAKTKDIKELQAKIEASLHVKIYLDKRIYHQNETQAGGHDSTPLSITDPATGLLNRTYLQDILAQEFLRSQRYGTLFSVIVMGVDCFKEVNDVFGHDIGDQILHELSVVIRSQIREVDLLARYGGDELAALLPQSSCDIAMIVAKRISEAVRVHVFPRLGKADGWKGKPLQVSMGICGLPNPHIHQAIQVISGADLALIRAKRMGRNRIEVATEKDISLISPGT